MVNGDTRSLTVYQACRVICASSRSIEGLDGPSALELRPHDRSGTINVTNEMLSVADSSLKNCLVKYRMLYRMSFSFCEPRPNASLKVIMPSSACIPHFLPIFYKHPAPCHKFLSSIVILFCNSLKWFFVMKQTFTCAPSSCRQQS
jgi:hypothetical protein